MSCLSPNKLSKNEFYRNPTTGNARIKFLGKFNADYDLKDLKDGKIILVPCGKCLNCRLDYARTWADRMILEYWSNPHACFVTLTYNDEHLKKINGIPTLVKSDVSRFMKNLRGRKEILGKTVRFFAAGEYGEKFHRPHYHLILFGIDLEDLGNLSTMTYRGHNELNQIYWESSLLDSVWSDENGPIGFTQVSEASWNTMNYVARYTVKKAKGDVYSKENGVAAEFTLMSRRPGIGEPFLHDEKNFGRLADTDVFYINNGKKIYWPRYLQKKYWSFGNRHIQVIDEHNCATHLEKDFYHDEFIKRINSRKKLLTDNTVSKYILDDRSYEEIQSTEELYTTERVKKLSRGDVTLS